MKTVIRLFAILLLQLLLSAHAVQIELEIKGQKQTVEFNPEDKVDLERAWNIWRKGDNKQSYIYFENCIIKVYQEPREDAKSVDVGSCYEQLNSLTKIDPKLFLYQPQLTQLTWDKRKWYPARGGWIYLDDSNIIYPDQLKPVKEWPIRYMAHYKGTDTAAAEEGIKPKYDEYRRVQFDREGYLLDNRTMMRKKVGENFVRMFYCRDFVKLTAVSPKDLEVAFSKDGGLGLAFNLKQALVDPKVEYDKNSGFISIWGSFDDPVKPVLDKNNGNACVIDCKDRKRWEP